MLRLWLAGLALVLAAPAALSQQFPNKPIRLVVPYPAGGATDVATAAKVYAKAREKGIGKLLDV